VGGLHGSALSEGVHLGGHAHVVYAGLALLWGRRGHWRGSLQVLHHPTQVVRRDVLIHSHCLHVVLEALLLHVSALVALHLLLDSILHALEEGRVDGPTGEVLQTDAQDPLLRSLVLVRRIQHFLVVRPALEPACTHLYLLVDYCPQGVHSIDPHAVQSAACEGVPVQHVQFPLHGGVPLVLLPVRRVLLASGSIGMSLDVASPNEIHPVGCALPCHHAAFALSSSHVFLIPLF
jgi:hypothetical protein